MGVLPTAGEEEAESRSVFSEVQNEQPYVPEVGLSFVKYSSVSRCILVSPLQGLGPGARV